PPRADEHGGGDGDSGGRPYRAHLRGHRGERQAELRGHEVGRGGQRPQERGAGRPPGTCGAGRFAGHGVSSIPAPSRLDQGKEDDAPKARSRTPQTTKTRRDQERLTRSSPPRAKRADERSEPVSGPRRGFAATGEGTESPR